MACPTYTTICIVIKKIKLNEADLIIEAVDENGSLIRFVAKSARRPGNTFSNRLELTNVCKVTCAKCKGLDIVREVKTITHRDLLRKDYIRFICACSICELAQKLCLGDKKTSVLFEFLTKTFDLLENCSDDKTLLILVAAILKFLAIEGLRPQLNVCSDCTKNIDLDHSYSSFFSFRSGGVVCDNCAKETDFEFYSTSIIALSNLLSMTYDEILNSSLDFNSEDFSDMFDILDKWIMYHVNYSIKSLKLIYRLI